MEFRWSSYLWKLDFDTSKKCKSVNPYSTVSRPLRRSVPEVFSQLTIHSGYSLNKHLMINQRNKALEKFDGSRDAKANEDILGNIKIDQEK